MNVSNIPLNNHPHITINVEILFAQEYLSLREMPKLSQITLCTDMNLFYPGIMIEENEFIKG